MIDPKEVEQLIQKAMPDAQVTITDRTGMSDHFAVEVKSSAFIDKNLMDQHRLVYSALDEAMKDGRIHAVELTTNAT